MSGVATVLLGLTFLVAVGDWVAVYRGDVYLDCLFRPLVLLLLIGVTVEIDPSNSEAWAWFVLALVASLIGDALLAFDREQLFMGGLTCFVTANLAYLAGMLFLGVDGVRFLAGAALAVVAVLVVGRKIIGGAKERQPQLLPPVNAYIGVVTLMAITAFAVGRPVGIMGAGLVSAADAMGAGTDSCALTRCCPSPPWSLITSARSASSCRCSDAVFFRN